MGLAKVLTDGELTTLNLSHSLGHPQVQSWLTMGQQGKVVVQFIPAIHFEVNIIIHSFCFTLNKCLFSAI